MSPSSTLLLLKWQAIVLLVLGQRQAAAACFGRMLEVDAHNCYALSSRAHLRAQGGDAEGAMQDYHLSLLHH